MAIRPFPKRVKVLNKTVAFPPICPHCLRPAKATIGIESGRKLSGYFVLFLLLKYSTIQVPFCDQFVRKLRIAHNVWRIAFFMVLAVGGGLVYLLKLDREDVLPLFFLLFIFVMGPALVFLWILRPDKYIELLAVTPDSIEFAVGSEKYAHELAAVNHAKVSEWYD